MFSLNKILLPVDFSDRSAAVARHAEVLASPFQSQLIMLHVDPTGRGKHIGELKTQLESFLPDNFQGRSVRRDVVQGDPGARIVEWAKTEQIDLIMMATHGYGPYRRLFLGSVAAKVLHDSDCPVWTSAHTESALPTESISYHRIACAIDLGPHTEKVLSWAAALVSAFDARLIVIHATRPIEPIVAEASAPDAGVELVRRATQEIADVLKKLKVEAEVAVESGSVSEVTYNRAARFAADLLIIGRHAAKGIGGRLHPHAYAIIRESPRPVVSV